MKISTIKWLKRQYKNTKIKNLSNKDNVRFYYKKEKIISRIRINPKITVEENEI